MRDEILTLSEVAQLLKVAEKTVYTMPQKDQLPAFKVGGQLRFKRLTSTKGLGSKRPFVTLGRTEGECQFHGNRS